MYYIYIYNPEVARIWLFKKNMLLAKMILISHSFPGCLSVSVKCCHGQRTQHQRRVRTKLMAPRPGSSGSSTARFFLFSERGRVKHDETNKMI